MSRRDYVLEEATKEIDIWVITPIKTILSHYAREHTLMGIGDLVEILKDRMSSKEGMHQDNSNIQRTKLFSSTPAEARIPHTLQRIKPTGPGHAT